MATNPFTFHTGMTYEPTGDQFYGPCCFCGKERKFYFSSDFQWDCKYCQRKGNLYSFLQQFHSILIEGPVSLLAEERSIPVSILLSNNVRYNQFRSNTTYHVFSLPTYNSDGKINNLYRAFPNPEKPGSRLVYGTPSLPGTLHNFPSTSHQTIWLVEGRWDKYAGEAIVGTRPITVIGWPGAKFDPKWARVLANKDVCIFNDNDEAGHQELKRVIEAIKQSTAKPKSIHTISWPEGLPKGFDVNDTLKIQGPQSYAFLESNLVEYEAPKVTSHATIYADEECNSFEKLLADASSTYYFTHDMQLLLLAMITSVYSLRIGGEQMWVRVEGAPGSSKTTIANIIGASSSTIMRDTFTGLLSGWKDDKEEDASMVPLVQDRALIVKDADSLLQQPNITQILSELRAFYDKKIAVTYRNRTNYDYENIRSSFIFCGTHELRAMDNTSLGERFLDFELHVTDADRNAISRRALQNAIAEASGGPSPEDKLKERAKGFMDVHLLPREEVADLSTETQERILALGSLISYMRANVNRDYKGNIKYKPHPEVPSRIVKQLAKSYLCAPIVFGSKHVPPMVHDMISHLAKSIINTESLRYKVARALIFCPGVVGDKLCEMLHPNKPERIELELQNMLELDMLKLGSQRTSTQLVVNTFALKDHISEQMQLII